MGFKQQPEGSFDGVMRALRYMVVYPAYSVGRIEEEEGWARRLRALGYDVECFGIPCPAGYSPFPKLHELWSQKNPELLLPYAILNSKMSERDVLISAGGAMLHPDFISSLPSYSVLLCADDPESSDSLSKPIATSFDFCFPMNIDCVDLYHSWGCKNVDWLFHNNQAPLTGAHTNAEEIRASKRDIDVIMLCERVYNASDRAQRIELLVEAFPQAFVRGRGWPGGFVDSPNDAFLRSRIGWNLHNSTGPVNTRTFSIPTFGVMQICDNKTNLGKIYKLDEEVVGFDTLAECIEKTHYYLTHEEERLEIAINGWRRSVSDYSEEKQWEKLVRTIAPTCAAKLRKALAPQANG